jgi:hypothetical protein
MLKTPFKTLLTIALPVALAVGCASNKGSGPTSDRPGDRVYAEGTAPEETPRGGIIMPSTMPPGAASTDWALADAIRGTLTADRTLAPYPSDFRATVEKGANGKVKLEGTVPNEHERQRLHESIASLPGVVEVDDQIVIGGKVATGKADLREPHPQSR